MTARTVAVRRALAQAGTKGLAHLASQQNTGTWISRCGRQIRSQEIRSWEGEQAGVQAEILGEAFCEECRTEAIRTAGTVSDGVAILLSLDPADDSVAQLLEVPVDAIRTESDLREPGDDLVASVRNNGVTAPIVARRSPTGLLLVSGGRRLAAARLAGLATIPTIVRSLDEESTTVDRLLDNLHRHDLDPIAQACAFQDALERLGISKQALADGLGISRPQVSNTIRLLGLPEHLQEHVAAGTITAEQARDLLRVEDPDEQDALADRFIADRTARRTAGARGRTPLDDQLAGIAQLLTGVLEAKVRVRTKGDSTEITIVVDDHERARVLTQLGIAA